ncbi:MAG: hypothetical protein JSR82_01080 [Verrucomicrobia bacterium]|nr:hypothetical protein [Verrucomicrobiota bacterium]
MTHPGSRQPGPGPRAAGFRLPASLSPYLLLPCALGLSATSDLTAPGNPVRFALLGLLAGLVYLAALRGPITPTRLWMVAIGARLLLLPAEPGDDFWRYVWEGRVQAAGFNPYVLAPAAPELAGLRDADWAKINHPGFVAAYPPGAQLIFRALQAFPTLVWKLAFTRLDLAIVALLAHWRRSDLRVAAIYGWNPLAIYAFAGAVHFDVLMVLALVGAARLLERDLAQPSRRALGGSALLLGVGIALKLVPLVLLPVWFLACGWRRAGWLLLAAVPPLVTALLLGWPGVDPLAGLRTFGRVARTNDCVWWLFELVSGLRLETNALPQLALAVGCGLAAWVFRRDWLRATLWVLGALLLLSPALHPWYLAWILPFAALRGPAAHGWLIFSVSAFAYFLLWLQPLPWAQPVWLRLLILLPPLVWWAQQRRAGAAVAGG